jgi:hypothetical protein
MSSLVNDAFSVKEMLVRDGVFTIHGVKPLVKHHPCMMARKSEGEVCCEVTVQENSLGKNTGT